MFIRTEPFKINSTAQRDPSSTYRRSTWMPQVHIVCYPAKPPCFTLLYHLFGRGVSCLLLLQSIISSGSSSINHLPRGILARRNSLVALLSLLLPLLRCVTFRGPGMNSRDLRLQRIVNQSMPCQRSLLLELRGDYHCRKCLAAAT